MILKDTYWTLHSPCEAEIKEKGSKFVAYATAIEVESDFMHFLESIKKLHPKARHWCYAWRLNDNHFRSNDDGEPSGTAGKPILGQIDSFGLQKVGIVVVRYFGGTLLGTSGLIQAYREASKNALASGNIIEKIVEDSITITFDYALMPDVMNALKKTNVRIIEQAFTDKGRVIINIRQSETENTLLQLKALILKISTEQAEGIEEIEGVEFLHT